MSLWVMLVDRDLSHLSDKVLVISLKPHPPLWNWIWGRSCPAIFVTLWKPTIKQARLLCATVVQVCGGQTTGRALNLSAKLAPFFLHTTTWRAILWISLRRDCLNVCVQRYPLCTNHPSTQSLREQVQAVSLNTGRMTLLSGVLQF